MERRKKSKIIEILDLNLLIFGKKRDGICEEEEEAIAKPSQISDK